MSKPYETTIGLEVHVQLKTTTKAFCGCPTVFGAPANSQVCPVCLGLPGALPVFNTRAFELGTRAALALHCQISPRIKFDRKNYFYPDVPKNYQISQFDQPLSFDGWLDIEREGQATQRVGITRAHLEEDAGKLMHDVVPDGSLVDYNRAGMPLLEIVSEPDMRGPDEAYGYLTILKSILQYVGVSDCDMEKGSLRCDANVSIRPAGQVELGAKVEIKNLNSFRAVRASLRHEEERQAEVLDRDEVVLQETRLWDTDRNVTVSMRSKEQASDYRYFPEPDLVPFQVDAAVVERIRATLPELPQARAKRFSTAYQLSAYDISVLTRLTG
jgi:aspartyl-tRNA(Asn)/glutamyl-tRNA(Gln) amidotransferase subunit B